MDVQLDVVETTARPTVHGVRWRSRAIGRGDGHAAREVLEPQRPARGHLDGAVDVFALVDHGVDGWDCEREQAEGKKVLSHGEFDGCEVQNVHMADDISRSHENTKATKDTRQDDSFS